MKQITKKIIVVVFAMASLFSCQLDEEENLFMEETLLFEDVEYKDQTYLLQYYMKDDSIKTYIQSDDYTNFQKSLTPVERLIVIIAEGNRSLSYHLFDSKDELTQAYPDILDKPELSETIKNPTNGRVNGTGLIQTTGWDHGFATKKWTYS